jgi:hypothetical protein
MSPRQFFGCLRLLRRPSAGFSASLGISVSFRRVKPSDYKLFQLADMFCTFELIALKFENSVASRSELDFFHSARDFKRNYLKEIRRKRLT